MNKENWKIAVQSRQWIMDALLDLMNDYDYDSLSISQICRKADLSRSTFYRLYNCKDDILIEKCTMLLSEYKGMLNSDMPVSYLDMASAYFEFWFSHKDFLIKLKKSNLMPRVFLALENLIPEICDTLIRSDNSICNSKSLSYINAYGFGGLNNMLLQWIQNNMETTPEEMTNALLEFINSVNS